MLSFTTADNFFLDEANLVLLCAQFYGSFYCNSMGKLSINSGSCSEFQIAMRLNIQQMTMRQKNHRFYRFSWSFDVSHSKRRGFIIFLINYIYSISILTNLFNFSSNQISTGCLTLAVA